MSANSSIILTNLDFESQKNSLKTYLKAQDRFKDYDFDGSNMSVLLDILTYNTHMNAFYLNMVANEMFLDTAQLRDSVVSHAKELNYTPRSFRSAEAKVTIDIISQETGKNSLVIPKGTSFSSRLGTRNFTFTTSENFVINGEYLGNSLTKYSAKEITLYEGDYVVDSFTYSVGKNARYVLSNRNIDTSSISVTVIEDVGATVVSYKRASSLFGVQQNSNVFFVQGAESEQYEIVFGDGVIGALPKNNSVILVEYRTCNGELSNGCNVFKSDGPIDGETNITITTVLNSQGGAVSETIESIKYNAPRHFTTQERAVTTEDYEDLLTLNFPEVNAVSAYGGEDLSPPQFGKVFVSVDLKDVDGLPNIKKEQYFKFLKTRSPVSIDPVIVDPQYMYIQVTSKVRYNINLTQLNIDDIRTATISSILDYSNRNLNNFNKTLRYSRLIENIDATHPSIVSNETDVKAIKYLKIVPAVETSTDVDFALTLSFGTDSSGNKYSVKSSSFIYDSDLCYLQDDSNGSVRIINQSTGKAVKSIGSVNYTTGLIQLKSLKVDNLSTEVLKIYAITESKDIFSTKNTILNINETDLSVSIEQIRE
jgi:hypothetical protein